MNTVPRLHNSSPACVTVPFIDAPTAKPCGDLYIGEALPLDRGFLKSSLPYIAALFATQEAQPRLPAEFKNKELMSKMLQESSWVGEKEIYGDPRSGPDKITMTRKDIQMSDGARGVAARVTTLFTGSPPSVNDIILLNQVGLKAFCPDIALIENLGGGLTSDGIPYVDYVVVNRVAKIFLVPSVIRNYRVSPSLICFESRNDSQAQEIIQARLSGLWGWTLGINSVDGFYYLEPEGSDARGIFGMQLNLSNRVFDAIGKWDSNLIQTFLPGIKAYQEMARNGVN